MPIKISFLLLWVGSFFINSIASAEKLKVGVIAGFTGDWSAYGVAFRHGIELAELDDDVRFIYEDDQFAPAKSISALLKLLQFDKVQAVLVGDEVTSQALAPLVKQKHIPMLSWAASDKLFNNNEYVLRLWSSPESDFGRTTSSIQSHGFKKIALFVSAHTYAIEWGRVLKNKFSGSSLEEFSADPKSFQPYILKLKASGIDAIGICLYPGANGLFAREMRELKVSIPLFGCNFIEASADTQAAGEAFDKTWFTAPKVSSKFWVKYVQKFGTTDHVFSAATFHDAAKLVNRAAQIGGSKPLLQRLLVDPLPSEDFALEDLKVLSKDGELYLNLKFAEYKFVKRTIVLSDGL